MINVAAKRRGEQVRTEMPNNVAVSGHAYLSAAMRQPDSDDDLKLVKLPLAKPQNCDHTAKVCKKCVHQWNWDYKIFLERTAGGRRLKTELPEGWERRNAVTD